MAQISKASQEGVTLKKAVVVKIQRTVVIKEWNDLW